MTKRNKLVYRYGRRTQGIKSSPNQLPLFADVDISHLAPQPTPQRTEDSQSGHESSVRGKPTVGTKKI